MKYVLLIFAFLASEAIAQPEVKIIVDIHPEVNYVTHLYTLAELGFSDPAYAAKYGNTLPKAAIDTLQKYKEYLTFGQGENAPYSWFFFLRLLKKHFPMQTNSKPS